MGHAEIPKLTNEEAKCNAFCSEVICSFQKHGISATKAEFLKLNYRNGFSEGEHFLKSQYTKIPFCKGESQK